MKKLSMLLVLVAILAMVLSAGFTNLAHAKRPISLVYFDGHMHTTYSDGSGSVEDIKATALGRGLDAVIITDHCRDLTEAEWDSLVAETTAASDGSFLALPGFEITGEEGLFNRDHIIAMNVDDPFVDRYGDELCPEEVWESPANSAGTGAMYPENITRWVDFVHSQGGIAVHNHPSGTTLLDYGAKHLEVYNQSYVDDIIGYATLLGYLPEDAWGLGMTLNNTALYGERDINMLVPFPVPGFPDPIPIPLRDALYYASLDFTGVGQWLGSPEAPLSSWDDLLLAYVDGTVDTPIFALANSDSHNTGVVTSTVGLAKNGVYVKGELSSRELFKALKAGRSFATTGPSLNFDVNGEMMGDEAKISHGSAIINLTASSESPTAIIAQIDIIKNGIVWQTLNPLDPDYQGVLVDDDVTEDGYYRVEITSLDMVSGRYYFAWSNPVFVIVD
jgi:hypothetical protein